jgi:hypothetical protein
MDKNITRRKVREREKEGEREKISELVDRESLQHKATTKSHRPQNVTAQSGQATCRARTM